VTSRATAAPKPRKKARRLVVDDWDNDAGFDPKPKPTAPMQASPPSKVPPKVPSKQTTLCLQPMGTAPAATSSWKQPVVLANGQQPIRSSQAAATAAAIAMPPPPPKKPTSVAPPPTPPPRQKYADDHEPRERLKIVQKTRPVMDLVTKLSESPTTVSPALTAEMGRHSTHFSVHVEALQKNHTATHYNATLEQAVTLIGTMASVIKAFQEAPKSASTAHGELGLAGAQVLMKLLPQLNEINVRMGLVTGECNGLASCLSLAVARAAAAEKK